jgi:hypothetical protein
MTPYEARKLQASVREVRKLIKEYGDSLRTECDAALAEVARLKAGVKEIFKNILFMISRSNAGVVTEEAIQAFFPDGETE